MGNEGRQANEEKDQQPCYRTDIDSPGELCSHWENGRSRLAFAYSLRNGGPSYSDVYANTERYVHQIAHSDVGQDRYVHCRTFRDAPIRPLAQCNT
jgi:hypothetical protein